MDVDEQNPPQYNLQPTNALAGPSTLPEIPPLYLPPPGPPPPRPYLTSTQDLVGRFQLTPAYDKYVRPYVAPVSLSGQPAPAPGATDKGKGKEKDPPQREPSVPAATPGAGPDGDDDDGKGEKKWKNSYRYLIKGVPGKHSIKKDDYLTTMIQVPPKQKMSITPFDLKTQREAFSVSLEGLKGFNINTLVAESPQAREDRKKRKELKRLVKAGVVPPTAYITAVAPSGATATPAPTAAATPSAGLARTGTPKPRQSSGSQSNPAQPRGRTPVGIGTPQSQSAATPGPGPGPTSHPAPAPVPAPAVPAPAPAAAPTRGVKRERDATGDIMPTQSVVGNGTPRPTVIVGAKAGNAGVRPRPVKKQRMDTAGQAREMPVQQPTPHA